jgi:hypothetical protein
MAAWALYVVIFLTKDIRVPSLESQYEAGDTLGLICNLTDFIVTFIIMKWIQKCLEPIPIELIANEQIDLYHQINSFVDVVSPRFLVESSSSFASNDSGTESPKKCIDWVVVHDSHGEYNVMKLTFRQVSDTIQVVTTTTMPV